MVKNVFSDFPGALADTNCPLGASVKKKPFSSLPKKVLRDKIAFQPKEGEPPQMSRWRSVDKKREKKSARHSALFLQQLIVSTNSSFRGNLARTRRRKDWCPNFKQKLSGTIRPRQSWTIRDNPTKTEEFWVNRPLRVLVQTKAETEMVRSHFKWLAAKILMEERQRSRSTVEI